MAKYIHIGNYLIEILIRFIYNTGIGSDYYEKKNR